MPKVQSISQQEAKLKELILYICRRSEGDQRFGSVKLNKELFYADFVGYLSFGHSITGAEYQKLPQGPAPRAVKPLLDEMEALSELVLAERNYYGKTQKTPIAMREANLSLFTAAEISLVDQMLDEFRFMNATQISECSHMFLGWKLAEEGETIPYSSALLEDRPLTDHEKAWASDLDFSGIEELLV